MTPIDCTDCYLAIEIGDGVKRALVRHFSRLIGERLAASDFAARDDATRDKLDRDAWRLATRVINDVEAELSGALDETLLLPDPQKSAQEILAMVVGAAAAAVEQKYFQDDLFGFEALVARLRHSGLGAAQPPA
ncbi:MAG TPA: hypothetical protein VNF99_17565 [Stellaceae bacterium]|nr:hypothetical protein [Stellaceae bacterium]